jgi:hypothetical protein
MRDQANFFAGPELDIETASYQQNGAFIIVQAENNQD